MIDRRVDDDAFRTSYKWSSMGIPITYHLYKIYILYYILRYRTKSGRRRYMFIVRASVYVCMCVRERVID